MIVKPFWSTATLRSPELGPPAIQATIDETPYTITEDFVRSQLQLADDGGIDDLPIAEIYSGMDNLGLNFEGHLMPLLTAMLSKDQEGEGAGQGQSSDLNIASFSRTYETDVDPFTNVEDEPLGGSFHMSPPRSTQAPPAGQTSGGAEDLITLTGLSSVVSTLVQKVNTLETNLKDHKKLFKDVVGKLVKKVKAMEVKLRTLKRKMVVSDSDQEERGKQDVDLNALLALANAAVTVDSNISPGGAFNNPTASTSVPADVSTSVAPDGVLNKGKTLMVEEDITVKEWTFKQMQEDRLGEHAAKRLHDEEQAQLDRQRAELQRRRQQEVLALTMYYIKADWINIMAQDEANASIFKSLLGDDVSEDNFPARMATLIKRKQQALAEKLAKEKKDMPMTQGQQRTYMRQFVKNQSCAMTLKRTCLVLEEPSSKRRKSLDRNHLTKPKSKLKELDLDADAQTFIKVVSNKDFEDEALRLWSALVGWEVIPTPLGDINAIYRIDRSTAYFTTLREILHMVDRQDLLTLYGLVVKYYANHPVAGAGLILWGDLQVLFDSHKGDVPYPLSVQLIERMFAHKLEIDKDVVGNDMTTAKQLIRFINNQLAAAQFAQNYRVFNSPMLHLLRVEMVINSPWIMPILGTKELASPEQTTLDAVFSRDISLICADFSSILVKTQSLRYVVPTGRVVVPTGRYVVPAGNVIIVSPGRIQIVIPG
nr:JmjC domain-containing protein [Tanacetum cinerariifolium]